MSAQRDSINQVGGDAGLPRVWCVQAAPCPTQPNSPKEKSCIKEQIQCLPRRLLYSPLAWGAQLPKYLPRKLSQMTFDITDSAGLTISCGHSYLQTASKSILLFSPHKIIISTNKDNTKKCLIQFLNRNALFKNRYCHWMSTHTKWRRMRKGSELAIALSPED